MSHTRPLGVTIAALLMMIFGLTEVLTAFTHTFFGIITVQGSASTYLGAGIGALYALAGFLILSMKRSAATLAIIFLGVVVVGRICLVATGLYPFSTVKQAIAMIFGTLIALGFAVFIVTQRHVFRVD